MCAKTVVQVGRSQEGTEGCDTELRGWGEVWTGRGRKRENLSLDEETDMSRGFGAK